MAFLRRLAAKLAPPPLEPAGLDFDTIYPTLRPELNQRAYQQLRPVAQSTVSAVLAPANPARRSLILVNAAAADLYLAEGAAASPFSYTVVLGAGQTYVTEQPDPYVGVLAGVWSAAGSGFAQITEAQ